MRTETFKRIIPLAGRHNVRLVIVNRRDYPGSSPYTDEEINSVKSATAEAIEEFGTYGGR